MYGIKIIPESHKNAETAWYWKDTCSYKLGLRKKESNQKWDNNCVVFQYINNKHSNISALSFVAKNSYLECSIHASNQNPDSNLLIACLSWYTYSDMGTVI